MIRFYFVFVLIFFAVSCGEKLQVGEKATDIKGWVEYQKKIKDHESGNNYYNVMSMLHLIPFSFPSLIITSRTSNIQSV